MSSTLGSVESRLFSAAETGDLVQLHAALATGVSVDTPDQRKSPQGTPVLLTPLMWACRQSQTAAASALLAAGASVSVRDTFGREALRHAAACGAIDAVRLLLSP